MNRTLLFGLYFFVSNFGYSQPINISGYIIIEGSNESLEGRNIVIINQNSNQRVLADREGLFTIPVNLNDILEVKSSLTVSRKIKITDNILSKKYIEIHLDIETIELAEANINTLKKNLKDNISKEKLQKEKMYELIGFNEEFKLDMIKYRLAAAYLKKYNGNISYENVLKIKDQFTKGARDYQFFSAKKIANKKIEKFDQILIIKSFLAPSYFVKELGISDYKIDDFINFCFDKYDFEKLLKTENYDQIMFSFSEEAPKYLKLLNNGQ